MNFIKSIVVTVVGVSLSLVAADAQSKGVKDAAYCKRAGDWSAKELTKRVSDRNRKAADAVRDFGPDQLASKEFFARYATNVIYTESFEVYDRFKSSGQADKAKNVLSFKLKTIGEVAEEMCLSELKGR